ncbi:hypothetical protein [Campylobacter hyointestinalis]|uniref:Uncharacterized protein n=3 Tax=Campylobacter hyointestinalis TaxID=198 RepID=A0A2S5JC51_CAMHY|nr:hypothetical protein [Campylobacter hyointestinalis]ANE32592.1 hypothetical protein CHH_0938 [Campylobacter hyointestinalis subsp. hyointestinalis LMG 9260]ANE34283.1 hypothetical protein CHL_0934 [Campylobacter hyointestinalis subsp. lawsonii CCUG 27631]KAB0612884.1 hypothetical protein F7P66_05695 [Campylobacter hyointestinalis subsp. lawsonii]KEA45064.1 ABC transporter [Campylobacter hyointestinalis subsp. hyointestinalis]MBT0611450.1 hypothetical protein [Campylobacter hyointestinalis s
MFENEKVLNTLASKVTELMLKYEEACETAEALRNELVSVKAQNEAKTNQIMRLEEELKTQNLASDDLLKQVEAVLGR